jgi:hypothetical protein
MVIGGYQVAHYPFGTVTSHPDMHATLCEPSILSIATQIIHFTIPLLLFCLFPTASCPVK